MIYDTDRAIKSILLIKLSVAGGKFKVPSNPADTVPLVSGAVGNATQWRPDVITNQGWTWRKDIATAPLASGASATNHVRRRPVELSYDAMVTDTPMIPIRTVGGVAGVRRADALWASLLAMYSSGDFVAVVSSTAVIETAQIVSLDLQRTADDGSAYFFSIGIAENRTFSLQLLSSIADVAAQAGAALTASSGVLVGGV